PAYPVRARTCLGGPGIPAREAPAVRHAAHRSGGRSRPFLLKEPGHKSEINVATLATGAPSPKGRLPMRRLFSGLTPTGLAVLTALASGAAARAQHGIVFSGAGPVNRGMGGAATAPLDASGTLYWNPAAIRGLPGSEMDVGVELLYPQSRLSSAVAPGALGPGVPPVGLAGSDRSDSGVIPVPTLALVYRPEESCWSYGLGLFTAGR